MVIVIEDKSVLSESVTLPTISSSLSEDDSSLATGSNRNSEADEPPAYEADGSLTPSPGASIRSDTVPEIPASNFLEIRRSLQAIEGKWRIDTALDVPERLLPPSPRSMTVRPNLNLIAEIAGINAEVQLSGGPDRAFLKATSHIGKVVFRLAEQNMQTVYISLTSHSGSVKLFLPRTFIGPIKIETDIGSQRFSPGIQANLTVFSEQNNTKHGFLGKYDGTGLGIDGVEWTGSMVVIESHLGGVEILYNDEKMPPATSVKKGGSWGWRWQYKWQWRWRGFPSR